MKQESKEIINWIKKQISISRGSIGNLSLEYWDKDKEKAIKFLDSLEEIESHLCNGGYIQDRNGTPCCNGDKVKIHFHHNEPLFGKPGEGIEGTLCWNNEAKSFIVDPQNGYWVFWRNGEGAFWFEKL